MILQYAHLYLNHLISILLNLSSFEILFLPDYCRKIVRNLTDVDLLLWKRIKNLQHSIIFTQNHHFHFVYFLVTEKSLYLQFEQTIDCLHLLMCKRVRCCDLFNLIVAFSYDDRNLVSLSLLESLAEWLLFWEKFVTFLLFVLFLMKRCYLMLFRLTFWMFVGFSLSLLTLKRFSFFINQIDLRLSREEFSSTWFFVRRFWFIIKFLKGFEDIKHDILSLLPVITKNRQFTYLFTILINVNLFVLSFQMIMWKSEMIKPLTGLHHNGNLIIQKHIFEHFEIMNFRNYFRLRLIWKLSMFIQFWVIIERIVVVLKLIGSVGCWISKWVPNEIGSILKSFWSSIWGNASSCWATIDEVTSSIVCLWNAWRSDAKL